MIAATASADGLAVVTTNPGDVTGLDDLVRVIAVPGPSTPLRPQPAQYNSAVAGSLMRSATSARKREPVAPSMWRWSKERVSVIT